ncbi:MAG: nickel-dependent lactate racemase [Candidatus Helarchaeota archaeon]|nr:nickel-dependent lactate racemase [Candidatus Helarchaeota archaeon]
MTKAIKFLYGSKSCTVDLPASWKLLGQFVPKDAEANESPTHVLSTALKNGIGSPDFDTLIRKKKNVVIISDDKSRPTPSNLLIPPLLDILNASGIPDRQIKIIVGRGLHPSLTERELKEKFGLEVLNRVQVLDHDPTQNLIYLGETSFGTKVHVNSEVVKADLKIGLGSIMPHELAGFTGGSGIIIPGVAGQETINQNHCLVGTFNAEFGKLEGNTIREDMEEAAKLLGLDFIINTILNSKNEIIKIVAGDPVEAHHMGVNYAKEVYGVKIPKLADISIVNSFPRGATFGKATKALFASHLAIKEDGVIILLAPCYQGISSSPVFREILLQNPSSDFLFECIEKGQLPGESCVLYLFAKVKEHRIIIVTDGVSPTEIEQIGLEYASTLEDAIQRVKIKNPEVIIFPKGAITLPFLY